jgi:membrane-associated protease RseP (regulator of RpoE activity)
MTRIKKPKEVKRELHPWKALIVAIALLVWAGYELQTQGETLWYWFFLVVGGVILLPNVFWIWSKLGTVFGVPYFFTMLKTKHFVNTIVNLGHGKTAKALEKISVGGLFLGFGIAGIDYWVARGQGGIKRILILIVGAIGLGLIFWYLLGILFSVPALAPLFWIALIGFVLLGFGGLSLAILMGYGWMSLWAFFTAEQICPSVAPVIPGVPIPGLGVTIPLIAWVSLGLIMIIHEFSHGILLAKYKEKIRSVGIILVGLVPMGAFVEQEDQSFLKKPERKQILVLSAGPSSNLLTIPIAFGLLYLMMFSIAPFQDAFATEAELMYNGIQISEVHEEISFCGITKEAPAKDKLMKGDQVIMLNGVDINSIGTLNKVFLENDDFNFIILRDGNLIDANITPVLFEGLNLKRIGVGFAPIPTGYEPPVELVVASSWINALTNILFFLAFLSFAVGMFNFMPSDPLDGGRIAKFVLLPYIGFMGFNKKDGQKFIGRLFAWLFLISILLNLLPYVTMVF